MEWSFKLPPSLGGGDFVLRELTIDTLEHIQDRVLWVAGRDDAKLMQASRDAQKEQLFRAIVSWQGEPVAAPELWWRERTSKERACVHKAYAHIHTLSDDEERYVAQSVERAPKE